MWHEARALRSGDGLITFDIVLTLRATVEFHN